MWPFWELWESPNCIRPSVIVRRLVRGTGCHLVQAGFRLSTQLVSTTHTCFLRQTSLCPVSFHSTQLCCFSWVLFLVEESSIDDMECHFLFLGKIIFDKIMNFFLSKLEFCVSQANIACVFWNTVTLTQAKLFFMVVKERVKANIRSSEVFTSLSSAWPRGQETKKPQSLADVPLHSATTWESMSTEILPWKRK